MLKQTFKYVAQILTAQRSPQCLACGVALGMAIGMMPKANLICGALVMVMFVTRSNLAAGLLAVVGFSWLSVVTDLVAEPLGYVILTVGPMQALYAWLFQLPLMPWLCINNTAVVGNLVLATIIGVPVYLVIKHRLSPRLEPRPVPAVRPPTRRPTRRFVIGETVS